MNLENGYTSRGDQAPRNDSSSSGGSKGENRAGQSGGAPKSGFDSLNEQFHRLRADISLYVEKRIELLLLTLTEPLSKAVAGLFQQALALLFFFTASIFVWVALALYLSELLDSMALGFLIGSLPLFLVASLFFRRPVSVLQRSVQSGMMESLLDSIRNARRSGESATTGKDSNSTDDTEPTMKKQETT